MLIQLSDIDTIVLSRFRIIISSLWQK